MNPCDPSDPLDELISRYLDDDLPPADLDAFRRRLEVEHDLRAEVDAFRHAIAQLQTPVAEPVPSVVQQHLAAARQAAGTEAGELAARRRRHARRGRRVGALSAVAASVLLVVGLFLSRDGDSSPTNETNLTADAATAVRASSDAGDQLQTDGTIEMALSASTAVFSDLGQLLRALRAGELATTAAVERHDRPTDDAASPDADHCEPPASDAELNGTATVNGVNLRWSILSGMPGPGRIVVINSLTCEILVDEPR